MNRKHPLPKRWILVRGLIRSQFHWKNFGEQLKNELQGAEISYVELPGNGYRHKESTPNKVEDAISSFESQVKKNGEPVGLIGVSLGGMLSTRWAQMYPQKFSHLVLINASSGLSPFYQRLIPSNYSGMLKNLFTGDTNTTETFILKATSNNENIWRKHLNENTEFLKAHPVSTKNFLRQLALARQTDFKNVPQCTKLILASRKDRLVSPLCSEAIAKKWECPIYYHEEAGHDLCLDDGAWVAKKIAAEFT